MKSRTKDVARIVNEARWASRKVLNTIKHHDGPIDDACLELIYRWARRSAHFVLQLSDADIERVAASLPKEDL